MEEMEGKNLPCFVPHERYHIQAFLASLADIFLFRSFQDSRIINRFEEAR